MGCTSSQIPDPNTQYGRGAAVKPQQQQGAGVTRNGAATPLYKSSKIAPQQQNGHVANGDVSFTTQLTNLSATTANGEALLPGEKDKLNDTTLTNDTASLTVPVSPREPSRTLRGDLSQRQEARISRELKLKDMQKVREEKAMRISELVMEEKERLSLSTMSRSRATSRTGSPRLHRGDSWRPCTSTQIETSFSSPVPKSGSEESLRETDSARPSALKSANGTRRRKGESKVRIQEDQESAKGKGRGKKSTNTIPSVDIVISNSQADINVNGSANKENSNNLL